MRVAVKYGKWKTDRYAEIGEFSVCLCSFIIEDSCSNGLADDVFPSPVSSGPHCTKTNLQRSENRSRKVRFHELSGLFLLFTVEQIIFPDHLIVLGIFIHILWIYGRFKI